MRKTVSYILLLLVMGMWLCTPGTSPAQTNKKAYKKALKSNDDIVKRHQTELFYMDGMKDFLAARYDKAVVSFNKALAISPQQAAIPYMMSRCYMMQGQQAEALSYAQRAVNLSEDNKEYFYHLARVYEWKEDYEQAIKTYNKMLKKHAGIPDDYMDMVGWYAELNELDEVLKVMNRAEKSLGPEPHFYLVRKQVYLMTNRNADALQEMKNLVKIFPEESSYRQELGEMYTNMGKTVEARLQFDTLLILDPSNAAAAAFLSDITFQEGNYAKSLSYARTAFVNRNVDLNLKVQISVRWIQLAGRLPDTAALFLPVAAVLPKYHADKGVAYAVNGDLNSRLHKDTTAWEYYCLALNAEGNNPDLWEQVIRMDDVLGKKDSLLSHSMKATVQFPNYAQFRLFAGSALIQNKRYEEAITQLEKGKKLSASKPQLLLGCLSYLGDAYYHTSQYDKSDQAFDQVLKMDSSNTYVLNNYCYYLTLRKAEPDKARRLGNKLIKLEPNVASYQDTYGWMLFVQGDYVQALTWLEKAAAKTTSAVVLEHYGDALYKNGRTEEAVTQWKKAKELGSASSLLDKKIENKKYFDE